MADPFAGVNLPSFSVPEIRMPSYGAVSAAQMEEISRSLAEAADAKSARGLVKRLMAEVREFEERLDESHEVGVRLVSFGQSLVFHVHQIGYIQPNLVTFAGTTDDSQPVRLVQHMSQLSFLLMRVPRLNPEQPRRPIGFRESSE